MVNHKTQIKSSYYDEEALVDIDFNENILKGVCTDLDKYSYYMTADEYKDFLEETNNEEFVGIGVRHTLQRSTEDFKIIHVYEGGGAYDAGLQEGDVISSVDGTVLTGMTLDEATDLLRGTEGTTITLGILRDDDAFEVEVTRKKVVVHDVDAEVLPDGTGYILISGFNGTAVEDFKNALSLVSSCDNCIIDLRANPGGRMDILIDILNQFVPDNLIATCTYRSMDSEEIRTTAGAEFPFKKLVVLVDSGTASCSEVMAGGLKDLGYATLVGKTTYGKGVIQGILPFGDGAVRLTIGRYILPSGFDVGIDGIAPDIEYTGDDMITFATSLFEK